MGHSYHKPSLSNTVQALKLLSLHMKERAARTLRVFVVYQEALQGHLATDCRSGSSEEGVGESSAHLSRSRIRLEDDRKLWKKSGGLRPMLVP